jgi:GNAT superfamily N-acetyltransferase
MLSVTTHDARKNTQHIGWKSRWVCLRPLGPDDATRYADFIAALDHRRIHHGTFALLPDPVDVAAKTANGDGRNVTYVAILDDARGTLLGIARAMRSSKQKVAKVAIVLRPDVEGQGLGRLLMGKLVTDCRASGLLELAGETPVDNRRMIDLARAFRFVDGPSRVPGFVSLRLRFRQPRQED